MRLKERYSFLKGWIKNPKQVGAVCQTSNFFVQKIADKVDWSGYVLELGAGLGNATSELIKHVDNPEKFAAIEIDENFCKKLKDKFPSTNIVQGSAAELEKLLPHMVGKVKTIVSIIPMMSLERDIKRQIVDSMLKMLDKDGYILQATYHWKPSIKDCRMSACRLYTTWANLPPIRLHKYTKHDRVA